MDQKHVHPLLVKYARIGAYKQPHCPGCGNGIVAQCMLRAIDELKLDMDKIVFASGIGCSSWIPSPLFNADVLHTTHGRSLAFATGVKLSNPELRVVVFTGDGDSAAIGGNHLIQAARKNIEILTVLVNNRIYGMTGGQVAPTTPHGVKTKTTPYGNLEYPFDLCKLVEAAGASYVARWTTFHTRQLVSSMKKGLLKKGFSFIEVISQCPVQYGTFVGIRDPAEMLHIFRKISVPFEKAKNMSREELEGKIVIGEFVDIERTGLAEAYQRLLEMMNL
ncbi:MAG: thiamine pyrophosphate-dependent enzyme [Candidatus Bathyarchaeota archaeon]|nr:thiamine pyrophosphate-dependent enzyme [Candidatus Bathyarchaeota archaeon]MDW8040364.1 thiamine pyrophosphate-dependent enzyme [Nitrososphaerota archaeon]